MISKIEDLKLFFRNKKNIKIIIIAGHKSFKKIQGQTIIKKILPNHKNEILFFFKKNVYPELNELKKLIFFLNKHNPKIILAIGGGSVIDYAKIANIKDLIINTKSKILKQEYDCSKRLSSLIAIPTTAGSGAEVTSSAVIYINKKKYSVEGTGLSPDKFFLIPELIIDNHKKLKSSAGFDAISQAIESIISVRSNKKSILFAKKSLQYCLPNYLNFFNKPNYNNCSLMTLGAMYSGKAINITKTTAPHAISYPFTSLYGLSHGHAVSLTLEKFIKFNFENHKFSHAKFDLISRYKILFDAFKVSNIDELINKIKFLKKNSKLENNFNKLNINILKDYNRIIDGVNIRRLSNNPIKLFRKDLKNILLK